MSACPSCGFEGYPGEGACPLCGEGPGLPAGISSASTEEAPTLPYGEGHAASPPPPRPGGDRKAAGELFAGRYRVEAFLGRGGMGTVYRVSDEGDDRRPKALKVLHAAIRDEPGGLERFQREAGLLARIRHGGIPSIHDFGTSDGEAYYVSDLVDGTDLKEEIRRRGPWPPAEAAALVATVADALGAAHAAGIVHRDVKPQNVMLARDGSVKLVDFGIARRVGVGGGTITATGVTLGTPEYMSPEQFESARVDARSDVYSLGVVLFELLTGSPPFGGDTPMAVAMKHRNEPPPLVRSLRGEVPAWLDRIVQTCLEKDRSRRFGSAAELAGALRRPRAAGHLRRRRLPTGDVAVEDDAEETEWALVLEVAEERPEWQPGMALLFSGQHYRLYDSLPPSSPDDRWTYRFGFWPEEEVLRGIVDYERDAAGRVKPPGVLDRFKRWRGGS